MKMWRGAVAGREGGRGHHALQALVSAIVIYGGDDEDYYGVLLWGGGG